MLYLNYGDIMAFIKGIYIQDIYTNSTNGYQVGLIRVKDSSDEEAINKVITFTGTFDNLKYKTTYLMNGEFVNHNKYGRQFNVSSYEIVLPTASEEIVEFLSSEIFPIGEKTALKIVNKLGDDALNIIPSKPELLKDIPRLTDAKIAKIVEVLNDYQSTSQIVIELNKIGFNTRDAISIMRKYGADTLAIIADNLYQIKDDIDISFPELDKIALNYGYDINDERRVEALTIYAMNLITFNRGDTYLYFDEIYDYVSKNTQQIDTEYLEYILIRLTKLGKVVNVGERYYLSEFYEAEEYISRRLFNLNNLDRRKLPKLDDKIRQLEFVSGIIYDDSQKSAIIKALNNNLTIITGGPGTGKTTIIRCIVRLLTEIMNINTNKLALIAPTGRAARKLMDTTGFPAMTIHKYLGWNMDNNEFEKNEYFPNKEDYIIVDEASMIDTLLMEALLKGTKISAKYIFVGDYYQLPSVSQGQILKDMIDSDTLDVVRLKKLYRQTEDSYINNLAYEIKNKELSEAYLNKYDDYNFIMCSDNDILTIISDIVKKALDKGYSEKDIQVLAPIYKSQNGIDALNKMLQAIMNPKSNKKNEITSGDIIYREGDKILQLVNDPDNSISNGDIGYIESITSANRTKSKKNEVVINFDGIKVTYTPKDFINITHGYAISVHKSQGGEFNMVIMPFSHSFKRMLYNKLIYTAVTRAKKSLILVGDVNSFAYGVSNDYIDTRKTTLKELLENKYNS